MIVPSGHTSVPRAWTKWLRRAGEFGTIKAPTLIVWSERDAFLPRREQEALAAAGAGAQLIAYAGAGNGFHWEEPARFAADLATFAAHVHVSPRFSSAFWAN